jgi:hypothetical protein
MVKIYSPENIGLVVTSLVFLKSKIWGTWQSLRLKRVKLMANPLANDKRSIIEVAAGVNSDGSYLKTADGLPLFTVSESPNLTRVLLAKAGENSIQIWQDDGAGFHRFRISNLDKMMAFDCGEIELK